MDGDSSAKTFESGANSALKDQDLTSGVHESVNQTVRLLPHDSIAPYKTPNHLTACRR